MVAGFSAKASQLTDKLIAVGPAAIAAGAAIGVVMVKNFIDAADKLTDLSERTGIAVDDLSRLGYVAQMSGISADEMTSAIVKLSNTMAMASVNGGTASRVFDVLGVSVKNTDGTLRSQVDVLKDVADKFASYEDGAAKTALAVQLFGKSGANLIPVLNAGAEGIQAMSDESDKLGNTINTRTAQAAAEFNDNLDRLAVLSGNASKSLSESLLPSLVSITDAMIVGIQNAQQYGNVFTGMLDELTNRAMQSTSPMLRFLAIFREAQAIQENTGFRGKDFEDPRKVSGQTAAPVVDDEAAKAAEAAEKARADELAKIREHELAKVQAFIDALKLREEARVAATMTEQQQEAERYTLEQEKLLEALELGLITKGEYQLMEQEALLAHREAMANIEMEALDAQLERERANADERMNLQKQVADHAVQVQQDQTQRIIGLLNMLGGKNKVFSLAAIALQTKTAFVQNKVATALAGNLAFASQIIPGDPTSLARATAAKAYALSQGAITGGLILAAGAVQAAGVFGSGGGGGSVGGGGGGSVGGGSSVGGASFASAGDVGFSGAAASRGQTVTIQLQGEIFGREQVRSLITQINEAVADGSVLRIA